ncbi:tetratricopeptide repeat protein 16-like [Polymixia lowei]
MEDQYVFPTAVSEEDLKEAGRRSSLNQLFGSRKIFLTSGQKHPERPDLQADVIIQNKALEHYSKGEQAMGRSQYDKAVTCFSKAMTLQPNQTQLHVSQAEAYLQLCDFQSATVCYKQACLLEPGSFHIRLAFIYHLQGQCLFDQGLFLEALGSFTKAAELKPDCKAYQMRSLVCLSALGRYSDCLKLVTDWLVSHRPEGDLYILRARLYKHLNQVTLCYYDVKSALALNPACPEAGALMAQLEESSERAREEASSRVLAGQLSQALSQINTALEHCPQDPRHYLLRGILYRRLKDFTASIEDLVLAVELSEEQAGGQARPTDSQEEPGAVQEEAQAQLVLTYNDFAVHCFSRGFYPEATLLLNNAIQEEKEERGLYLNRGDCFFKQGEWGFALADYQQAEEMSPGDPAVCLRLAVLHNTLGSHSYQEGRFQEAADSLSLAIQYNPRDSLYYENRAKAFHKTLNLEGAKQDAISTLVLDPTNQEVMLPSGESASEVLA